MRVSVSFSFKPKVAARENVPAAAAERPDYSWGAGHYFFLIIAMVCLGFYGYEYFERAIYQTYEAWSFDQDAARRTASPPAAHHNVLPDADVAQPAGPMAPPPPPSPDSIVGRLSIPRLRLSVMVREGVDGKTLQLAVGHIPSTPLPGQAGNVGVAGHRDTFFRGLKDLRTADEVEFATAKGSFLYKVESLMIVEPDNIGVLAASGSNVLTMVTCYPFSYIGNAPKRFVVRARQVSPPTWLSAAK